MADSKRIAVTGCAGRIGKVVCRRLAAQGHDIVGIDRRTPDTPVGTFIYGDAADRQVLQPALAGCDAVIHLGEIPSPLAHLPPNEIYASNTRTCASVLQSAAELKIKRVVYVSTCQTYGMWGAITPPPSPALYPSKLPFDETEPLKPANCYAASKAANEWFCRSVSQAYGLSIAIFRLPATFEFTTDPVALRWWKRAGEEFGEGFWTYLLCDDASRAFELAIEHPRPGCEAYHLTARNIFGTIPLRDRILKHYPGCPLPPADWPELASPLDTGKAKAHFGWESTLDITTMLNEARG